MGGVEMGWGGGGGGEDKSHVVSDAGLNFNIFALGTAVGAVPSAGRYTAARRARLTFALREGSIRRSSTPRMGGKFHRPSL